jgi:hypothetical protein
MACRRKPGEPRKGTKERSPAIFRPVPGLRLLHQSPSAYALGYILSPSWLPARTPRKRSRCPPRRSGHGPSGTFRAGVYRGKSPPIADCARPPVNIELPCNGRKYSARNRQNPITQVLTVAAGIRNGRCRSSGKTGPQARCGIAMPLGPGSASRCSRIHDIFPIPSRAHKAAGSGNAGLPNNRSGPADSVKPPASKFLILVTARRESSPPEPHASRNDIQTLDKVSQAWLARALRQSTGKERSAAPVCAGAKCWGFSGLFG